MEDSSVDNFAMNPLKPPPGMGNGGSFIKDRTLQHQTRARLPVSVIPNDGVQRPEEAPARRISEQGTFDRQAAAWSLASLPGVDKPKETYCINGTTLKRNGFHNEEASKKRPRAASKAQANEQSRRQRQEKNAREKERSTRITEQINEIKDLLVQDGIMVGRATKSAVLTEAATYIRKTQHQVQGELPFEGQQQQQEQLPRRVRSRSSGPPPPVASSESSPDDEEVASTLLHLGSPRVDAQSDSFVPTEVMSTAAATKLSLPVLETSSTRMQAPAELAGSSIAAEQPEKNARAMLREALSDPQHPLQIQHVGNEICKQAIETCPVPVAIAELGGTFTYANRMFLQMSGYSQEALCSRTIFDLTVRQDLEAAYEQVFGMISKKHSTTTTTQDICSVAAALKEGAGNHNLCIQILHEEAGPPKCFSVTIVDNG